MALQKTNTSGIYKQVGKNRTSYVVMYSVRVSDPAAKNGWKWKPKGKTFPTYAAAISFKVKNQNENRSSHTLEPADLTVEQLCQKWLEYKRPHIKVQTYDLYETHVNVYI